MRKNLLLLVILSATYFPGIAQTLSQTRTATFLNNLNNFQQVFGHQNYQRVSPQTVSADDNVYGCSNNLTAVRDSTSSFSSRSVSSLALQGFGFTIPDKATISKIAVRVRRFKSGAPSVGDHTFSVMQRYQCGQGTPCRYGVFWTYMDNYPAKIYPATETEYVFSQSGSGTNGGFNHKETYQWTPAMVNHQYFGVRVDNYIPIGKGSVSICYDLVEMTVEYTPPASSTRKHPALDETILFKQPVIYPNPLTRKSSLQFTAAETGTAAVDLYNMAGAKINTLFSGNVVKGQVYNVAVGELIVSKGTYVFFLTNGQQRFTGKLIKLE